MVKKNPESLNPTQLLDISLHQCPCTSGLVIGGQNLMLQEYNFGTSKPSQYVFYSHEVPFDNHLEHLQFLDDFRTHQIPCFPNEATFSTQMISIDHTLYPSVKLLWCPEKNIEQKVIANEFCFKLFYGLISNTYVYKLSTSFPSSSSPGVNASLRADSCSSGSSI